MAASTLRPLVLRTSAAAGAAALAVGYFQRRGGGGDGSEYRLSWSQGLFTRGYRSFMAPFIMQTDPEFAHKATIVAGAVYQSIRLLGEPAWTGSTPLDWLIRPSASSTSSSSSSQPILRQELFSTGLQFHSPVGIAAGFDKNAALVPLFKVGGVPGLGFSEVGSISALPAEGNDRPRCFRLVEDEAVINRMGLNNDGAEVVARRMEKYSCLGTAADARVPIGVNIAKTHSPDIMGNKAVEDFAASYRTLAPYADFVVLNVSCPNTAEGKTFEDPSTLKQLLSAVAAERAASTAAGQKPPVLVKLSPPPLTAAGRDQLRILVGVADASGIVDGFVVSNTVGDRDIKLTDTGKESAQSIGRGGLSGKPIQARSTAAVRAVYEASGGRYPIIGVGGIDSAEAAYEKIRAGASLVEVYTGLVFNGPGLITDINAGIRRKLDQDGFASISEAIGADVRGA
mmetsp:Transcript_7354/g.16065  ORF Transcript_7354/g.16065 Transcript_7354/m.16065 type:complete len:455 (-) Transcript_7354:194-1558(-)|eukprot:CAMPEP_0178416026 /NCGR_PEP_ID=MMETSP0689_2-20121128/23850_1 /TAXON_ID=160604 /ORGANISM="Amphidinium massartii, Strain CS-259" /LENGTH=454 /DNA_ID=CAMNT_0020037355 /DNA_START=48 /DNA_END=1412 /DNA_ORIENTATION=-